MKKQKKAFFFDRDNTLIKDKGYTFKKKDLKFLPGVKKAIRFLNQKKILVIVLTNQSGIVRKYFKFDDVKNFHNFMNFKLRKSKAYINDFFTCGCHPSIPFKNNKCKCRKPKNYMHLKAIKKWLLKRKNIIMIGDKYSDKISAKRTKIKFYYKSKKINLDKQIFNILQNNKTFLM